MAAICEALCQPFPARLATVYGLTIVAAQDGRVCTSSTSWGCWGSSRASDGGARRMLGGHAQCLKYGWTQGTLTLPGGTIQRHRPAVRQVSVMASSSKKRKEKQRAERAGQQGQVQGPAVVPPVQGFQAATAPASGISSSAPTSKPPPATIPAVAVDAVTSPAGNSRGVVQPVAVTSAMPSSTPPAMPTTSNASAKSTNAASASNNNSSVVAPVATRDSVLGACAVTSGLLLVAGVAARQGFHWAAQNGFPVGDATAQLPVDASPEHLLLALALAGGVTAARVVLVATWPDFATATDVSNRQVLTSLQPADLLFVSCFPGLGEEWLFRGALLPAAGLDWRGVAVSGLVFGLLHINGGRNAAFAAWASMVGIVYGASAVISGDLMVPVAAHAVANLMSAALWRAKNMPASK